MISEEVILPLGFRPCWLEEKHLVVRELLGEVFVQRNVDRTEIAMKHKSKCKQQQQGGYRRRMTSRSYRDLAVMPGRRIERTSGIIFVTWHDVHAIQRRQEGSKGNKVDSAINIIKGRVVHSRTGLRRHPCALFGLY